MLLVISRLQSTVFSFNFLCTQKTQASLNYISLNIRHIPSDSTMICMRIKGAVKLWQGAHEHISPRIFFF